MRESQKLNLTELRLRFKHLFQLATFRTARNLFAFSSRIEKLDLYYKVAISKTFTCEAAFADDAIAAAAACEEKYAAKLQT